MVAFSYDNWAVGSLYYSREVPSLLRGLRLSKISAVKASSPSKATAPSWWLAARAGRA